MKYCKKCGVLYDGSLPQCPKCNDLLAEYEEPPAPEASRQIKIRQWIGIIIGIPALIGVIYFVLWGVAKLSGRI
ncbi:MAG: hypothetical protein RRZ24_04820 [Clostridia bacterium]